MTERAHLVLADGTTFEGLAFGAAGIATGEAVFTTAMTGYEEILTDPSYTGQLVAMTSVEIGNYGINPDDVESTDGRPRCGGLIIRHLSPTVSNYRSQESLDEYLKRSGIVGISEIDTRKLTCHLRDHGAQNAALAAVSSATPEKLHEAARMAPDMNGLDLVARVTPKEPYSFTEARGEFGNMPGSPPITKRTSGQHVVCIDFGVKRNMLRCFVDAGARLTCVPATTTAEQILALKPTGVFLSNGPGDPAAVTYAVATIRALLGKVPIFGICLGHQLLALALGARTYKLKFGHRGANQPVKDLATGRIEITSQNHGFAVDLESLPKGVTTTHVHLNDGTSEGLEAKDLRAFSVQYHPEASSGPHDALYLFDRFTAAMENFRTTS